MEQKTETVTVRLSYDEACVLRRFDEAGNTSKALRRMIKVMRQLEAKDIEALRNALDANQHIFSDKTRLYRLRQKLEASLILLNRKKN